jgi:DNA-binding transcriptional LysR family regulator
LTTLPGRPQSEGHQVAPGLLALRVEILVSFAVLAEELHFTRAAATMYMSQSGLSRRIAALERCLGVAVLDRTPHGVVLTAAGRELLPHALSVLASLRAATAEFAGQATPLQALRSMHPGTRSGGAAGARKVVAGPAAALHVRREE